MWDMSPVSSDWEGGREGVQSEAWAEVAWREACMEGGGV